MKLTSASLRKEIKMIQFRWNERRRRNVARVLELTRGNVESDMLEESKVIPGMYKSVATGERFRYEPDNFRFVAI